MIFKPYECDFGVKYKDVNYDFEHVQSLQIEDPEMTKLVRGSNAKNKVGLVYTEGTKDPKKCTVTLIGVSAAINSLLTTIYEAKDRCEFYAVSRVDGSSVIGKNSILSQQPRQLLIDETQESMNVALVFETFDLKEVHKA